VLEALGQKAAIRDEMELVRKNIFISVFEHSLIFCFNCSTQGF